MVTDLEALVVNQTFSNGTFLQPNETAQLEKDLSAYKEYMLFLEEEATTFHAADGSSIVADEGASTEHGN